jgi:hypothetical protein
MSSLGGSLKAVDWASQKISHFEKNFYVEDKRVAARSDREIEEFRRAKEMKVRRSVNYRAELIDSSCAGSRSQCPKTYYCLR